MWALGGRRRTAEYRTLRADLEYAEVTEDDAEFSAALRLDLRTRGFQLALPDALIAAVALRLDLTLLTADRDFAPVPHLRTDDWLAP